MARLRSLAALVLSLSSGTFAQAAPAQPAAPASGAASQPARATGTLTIGDKAPPLAIAEWIKGDPVAVFEPGKIYVVEFWASWCGPCLASMPHLTELQAKYRDKGVTIVGVTSEDTRGNTLDAAKSIVRTRAEHAGYTFAWDTARRTNDAYMRAAGERYIPRAFIVNREGVVAFIGSPREMDEPLAQIVAGTYDLADAIKRRDTERAPDDAKRAEQRSRMEAVQRTLNDAIAANNKDAAVRAFDEFTKLDPGNAGLFAIGKYRLLIGRFADPAGAYAVARANLDGAWRANASYLNEAAWRMVDPKGGVDPKDLDLASLAATRAVELTKEKDAGALHTLARVHFLKGDALKAVELETKALSVADPQRRAAFQAALDEYRGTVPAKK
jgi:thiol-disulfide isomerase/thioredoxin